MEKGSVQRNRYRVYFYRGRVLEHELGVLGVDDRDALEVAKKYLRDMKEVDWTEFEDYGSEPKPMTVRFDDGEGIEVIDLLKLSAEGAGWN